VPSTTVVPTQLAGSDPIVHPAAAEVATPGKTEPVAAAKPKTSVADQAQEISTTQTRRINVGEEAAPSAAGLRMPDGQSNLSSAIAPTLGSSVALISVSNVKPPTPLEKPAPVYPPFARQSRIAGTVVLQVAVGVDGRPTKVTVVSGQPMLANSAQNAVKNYWRFSPATLNGKAVEGEAEVRINFNAPK
jgi:periplasmic protein TonB